MTSLVAAQNSLLAERSAVVCVEDIHCLRHEIYLRRSDTAYPCICFVKAFGITDR